MRRVVVYSETPHDGLPSLQPGWMDGRTHTDTESTDTYIHTQYTVTHTGTYIRIKRHDVE